MMRIKLSLAVIAVSIVLCPGYVCAKNIYFTDQVIYRGKAKKNIPNGVGNLFVCNKDVSCYDIISGNFTGEDGRNVINGKIVFPSDFQYEGELSYTINEDNVEYHLNNGTLAYYVKGENDILTEAIRYDVQSLVTIIRPFDTFIARFTGPVTSKRNCSLPSVEIPGKNVLLAHNLVNSNITVHYSLQSIDQKEWKVVEKYSCVDGNTRIDYYAESKKLKLSYNDGRWIFIPDVDYKDEFSTAVAKVKDSIRVASGQRKIIEPWSEADFFAARIEQIENEKMNRLRYISAKDGSGKKQQGEKVLEYVVKQSKDQKAYTFRYKDGSVQCKIDVDDYDTQVRHSEWDEWDEKTKFKKYILEPKIPEKDKARYCTVHYNNGNVFKGICYMEADDVLDYFKNQRKCPSADSYFRGRLTLADGSHTDYFNGWTDKEIDEKFVPYFEEQQRIEKEAREKKEAEEAAAKAAAEKAAKEEYNAECNRYGKKYVDLIREHTVRVGMPKELVLKYFSRKNSRNGYSYSRVSSSSDTECYELAYNFLGEFYVKYYVWIDSKTKKVTLVRNM